MKIGVIGIGVVGGAILKALKLSFDDVVAYDIKGGHDTMAEVCKADVVFICVPTPTIQGVQNLSALNSVFANLDINEFKGIAVIKSTVLPGTCRHYQTLVNFSVVHNPEFLTAAQPYADFLNQKMVLLSGNYDACKAVSDVYSLLIPDSDWLHYKDWEITETAKYMHNCFLALKVAFCNEFYRLSERIGVDYQDVRAATISQGGLGDGHTDVPGPDGKFGFGGMCFLKDTEALERFVKDDGRSCELVSSTISSNKRARPSAYNGEER